MRNCWGVKLTGLTAEQILSNPLLHDSSRHLAQAASWLDYLLRTQKVSAIHYAAIELRYGIEYLLAELLVLNGKLITEAEYQECLGKDGFAVMKGKLGKAGAQYEKLAVFTMMVVSVSSSPRFTVWNLASLSRSWGVSSKYLHFRGSHARTYADDKWLLSAIAELQGALAYPLGECQNSPSSAIMRPDGMEPEIRRAWDEFNSGTLSEAEVKLRLSLLEPALVHRHVESFSHGTRR